MSWCSGAKKQSNLLPPEIVALKSNSKFASYTDEALYEYYYEFKQITQNSNNLNRKQFYELIRAFNVN